jgi:hypothetical protein
MQSASTNPILLAEERRWLFTKEEINATPSMRGGMPLEAELKMRKRGVEFIKMVGGMMGLPRQTTDTASVFFHRYFMRSKILPRDGKTPPGQNPKEFAGVHVGDPLLVTVFTGDDLSGTRLIVWLGGRSCFTTASK